MAYEYTRFTGIKIITEPTHNTATITVTGHCFSEGDQVSLWGLEPTGLRGYIYRFLYWTRIFRIEARMFRNLTEKVIEFKVTGCTTTTFEVEGI